MGNNKTLLKGETMIETRISRSTINCESHSDALWTARAYRTLGYKVDIFSHNDVNHDVKISKTYEVETVDN